MEIRTISSAGYNLWTDICEEGGVGSGSIELELGWQLCAIPVQYGYWDSSSHQHVHDDVTVAKCKNYIIDQIEDLYGTGKIERASTYTGDEQAFFNYNPGSTPEASPHNWQLTYDDGIHKEISGFWIKTLTSGIVITWGE